SFVLPQPAPYRIDFSLSRSCDGKTCTVVAHVVGGRPPYNYKWSNGKSGTSNGDITITGVDCYAPLTLSVTDGVGCQFSGTTTIASPHADGSVNAIGRPRLLDITITATSNEFTANGCPVKVVVHSDSAFGTPTYYLYPEVSYLSNDVVDESKQPV